MRHCTMVVGVASLVSLLVAGKAWGAVQYTVTDLGTPGATWSVATGINNVGQVVGWDQTASSNDNVFLYSGGSMQNIGSGYGYAINDNGQAVGSTAGGSTFLYSGSSMQYLGRGYGYGINNLGQVVGQDSDNNQAVLYSGGSMSYLGTLGGDVSRATGINDNGQVVGWAQTVSGYYNAFLYSDGTMQGLGTLGGNASFAYAVNNSGQVVGLADIGSGHSNAFLYSGGTMKDLGTLDGIVQTNSVAYGINDNGLIVGYTQTASDGNSAFLYSGGVMEDLNSLIPSNSGWTLEQANGINDSGQIVGYGLIGGYDHAFLLNPVPEPSTLTLLGTAALGLLGWAWRRRRAV